jgi:hypothetical protein
MSATTWCVVYNGSPNPEPVDEDGRTCYPAEFTHAKRSVVKDLIDRDVLMLVDPDGITDSSVPAARMAKEEVTRLNGAIDAEKAQAAAKESAKTSSKSTSKKQSE